MPPRDRVRAKAVDAEFGTRFAPKLKEGARLGDGKARRVQTCGYYDAFRGSKTSFSVVSATWHLAPCPPAACAIAHGSGAGDRSPKRPRKYARRLVRMVFQALCHRAEVSKKIVPVTKKGATCSGDTRDSHSGLIPHKTSPHSLLSYDTTLR